MKGSALTFFIPLLIFQCDHGVLWKDHPYEVSWIDIYEHASLQLVLESGNSIGRVDPVVTAVGANDLYVVARQSDPNKDAPVFWIIDRSSDHQSASLDDVRIGPLDQAAFDERIAKGGLPKLIELR